MAETSAAVANYFIDKALEENRELTPMKLIKLVYLEPLSLAAAHNTLAGLAKCKSRRFWECLERPSKVRVAFFAESTQAWSVIAVTSGGQLNRAFTPIVPIPRVV